jgi:hypothetical protein
MSQCKCSMSISVLGDGCRYCQPQEYIDRIHDQMEDDRAMVVPDGWMELAKRADDFLYSLEETDAIRRLRADLCAMLAASTAPGDSQ